MQDFTTGWFDTKQTNLQAKCNARITRNFKEIRIDWTVYMALKVSSASISKDTYIDIMVASNPTKMGEDQARIKDTTESWNGTAEHSINGVLTFEDEAAGTGILTFSSTGNFSSPAVFDGITLSIRYDEYDSTKSAESSMPFHSVFTTEEYLENHKGLIPRNIICNNKSQYVFRYNEYKNAYRKF
jgi:hypothetical protein